MFKKCGEYISRRELKTLFLDKISGKLLIYVVFRRPTSVGRFFLLIIGHLFVIIPLLSVIMFHLSVIAGQLFVIAPHLLAMVGHLSVITGHLFDVMSHLSVMAGHL